MRGAGTHGGDDGGADERHSGHGEQRAQRRHETHYSRQQCVEHHAQRYRQRHHLQEMRGTMQSALAFGC
jgi:hypothetical protein